MSKTLNEIMRIPLLLKKAESYGLSLNKEDRHLFVGCGSSYNIGYISSKVLKRYGIRAQVRTAGKLLVTQELPEINKAFLISRTGESTETIRTAELLKSKGIYTFGITCEPGTGLTEVCDESLVLDFSREESVVMTGSFLVILTVILNSVGSKDQHKAAKHLLDDSMEYFKNIPLEDFNHFVFLGYDENYGIAKEGALKLQEMALERVEYHEPLEFRHGPISTLTRQSFVTLISKSSNYEKTLVEDLKKLGATVSVIGEAGDFSIKNENGLESPLKIIPLLILGYLRAIKKGLNPDKPKNLSKSVII
ncbi:SIS domain-containing protein [Kosmotoga pacifica]|uniref:Sugar isomerase n=1 Tax=Kosmotoga pacifica TaxID=1330330 RepID=A0A0G2ZEX8_9BACT|nr:SIS domain-containing protein [Kosmotoga pacifica]AKI97388.1 sugar isomerase [Kosmotoga pacifica]